MGGVSSRLTSRNTLVTSLSCLPSILNIRLPVKSGMVKVSEVVSSGATSAPESIRVTVMLSAAQFTVSVPGFSPT